MGISKSQAIASTNLLAKRAEEFGTSLDGKVLLRGNINDEINDFMSYYNRVVGSANKIIETTIAETTKEDAVEEFEIVDNEDELSNTSFFSNTFLASADTVFGAEETKEVEPVKEDTVSDNSFIISKDEFETLNRREEVRPEDSFTEAITPVVENEVAEGEVISFEEEKTNAKVKKIGKRAAYVDTVILCLIAQLSIFGLLIIVLLIIK